MKAGKGRSILFFMGIIYFSVAALWPLVAEEVDEALACLDALIEKNKIISNAMWEYIKASAHIKDKQQIENKRKELIALVKKSSEDAKKLIVCQKDKSLYDSYLTFLNTYYFLLTEDFAKIVDMEAVAEQSYDDMEAYHLAKRKAIEKTNEAASIFNDKKREFAKKNNINLIQTKSEISEKLEKSSKVMDYYDEIYLIFFKSYKQEMYLIQSVERSNINEIEQNRGTLLKYAEEGLKKLGPIKAFEKDNSLKDSCGKMLNFYKKEAAEKSLVYADYFLKQEAFLKIKEAFELKKEEERTKEDVDKYNAKVKEANKACDAFNKVNAELNKEREKLIQDWNKIKNVFIDTHIPK
jgi:hypothetical protein